MSKQSHSGLLGLFLQRSNLTSNGLKAEAIGKHAVRIRVDGRFVGIWRQVVGAYEWHPADSSAAQRRVATAYDAVMIFEKDFPRLR
jgi:hypothetical protein